MSVTIWHNPRCSKSRAALAALQERGLSPSVRLYLKDPPPRAEIEDVLQMLGVPAAQMMRTKDAAFKDAGLTRNDDDATLIAAMAANSALIERPIVIANGKAAIGRPTEVIFDIL